MYNENIIGEEITLVLDHIQDEIPEKGQVQSKIRAGTLHSHERRLHQVVTKRHLFSWMVPHNIAKK